MKIKALVGARSKSRKVISKGIIPFTESSLLDIQIA